MLFNNLSRGSLFASVCLLRYLEVLGPRMTKERLMRLYPLC